MTFAKFVLSRFFALATRNNKAYVELLFWKNVGAVREITEGYNKEGCVGVGLRVFIYLNSAVCF